MLVQEMKSLKTISSSFTRGQVVILHRQSLVNWPVADNNIFTIFSDI